MNTKKKVPVPPDFQVGCENMPHLQATSMNALIDSWAPMRRSLFPVIAAILIASGCNGEGHLATALAQPPVVTANFPVDAAIEVATSAVISADFQQPIDPSTLTAATFTVACPSGTSVAGAVSYDAPNHRAVFTPAAALPGDVTCTASINTGIKSNLGVPLASEVQWTFATALDPKLVAQGQQIFRFDTFGDETQWTDTLRMHEVIRTAVDPVTALSVGLKVDSEALPTAVVQGIQDGSISLTSPATTVALLKLNAVVGVQGTVETFSGTDTLTRVGITCALCHSTVDNSFAPGIGKRLDGWPNRDLDPGAIIALSPALSAEAKAVYNSWGPGKYDPRFNFDGLNGPQVIPPAFGLRGIHSITSTGDGQDLAYWNRYVGVTQMGGHGTFSEPRTGVMVVNGNEDLISDKLPALQAYQLSIAAPPPPPGSFDAAAALRGEAVFTGVARCSTCHIGAELTDANSGLHAPHEVVSEPEPDGVPSYASRSATKQYRTAPLKGLWQHPPYFHNGTAATLDDVVVTYNTKQALGLADTEMADLVEYLKSL